MTLKQAKKVVSIRDRAEYALGRADNDDFQWNFPSECTTSEQKNQSKR